MQRLNYLHKSNIPTTQFLINSDWIDDFLPIQIETLSLFFQTYIAPIGTIIIMEGEPTNFFCLIYEGAVDVVKENSTGKMKQIKSLGQGKVIGEMAFFDRSPATATIIAKEQSTLLIMDEDAFDTLSAQSPHLALQITIKLIRTISSRLRETNGKLVDLLP